MIHKTTMRFLQRYFRRGFRHIPEELKTRMHVDVDNWFIFDGTRDELSIIKDDLDVSVEVRVQSFARPGEELRRTMRPHLTLMEIIVDGKPYLLFSVGDPECLNIFENEWIKYSIYKRG